MKDDLPGVSHDPAAHLFVIYWGLASFFTPPMCIVVYVTISISGGQVWETGWEALRLGMAAFLIPFAFVLNNGLLLRGDIAQIVLAVVTATIGEVLVACGIRGYTLGTLGVAQRVLVIASGLLFIAPGLMFPLAGLLVAVLAYPLRHLNFRTANSR
ncbi:MAG: TRAP transporter large permease subunit [Nitrospinota bacterium]